MGTTDTAQPAGQPSVRLRRVGFFDEFTDVPGPEGSIRAAVRPTPRHDAVAIAEYLDSGPLVLAFTETTLDVVDGVSKIPDGGSLVTDGSWVWDTQLSHYFRRYNIALPDEFLRTVRANRYVNPWDGMEDLSVNVTW
jgi:hypothetical protein